MKMEEIKEQEFVCLVAPDGTPQLSTLTENFSECIGLCEALSASGLGIHPARLFEEGFQILPVKLTIIQNGTAKNAFEKGKAAIQNSNKG